MLMSVGLKLASRSGNSSSLQRDVTAMRNFQNHDFYLKQFNIINWLKRAKFVHPSEDTSEQRTRTAVGEDRRLHGRVQDFVSGHHQTTQPLQLLSTKKNHQNHPPPPPLGQIKTENFHRGRGRPKWRQGSGTRNPAQKAPTPSQVCVCVCVCVGGGVQRSLSPGRRPGFSLLLQIDQTPEVHEELQNHRQDGVHVEYVWQWAIL